jgi:amino acid adenylation domain-containing protein
MSTISSSESSVRSSWLQFLKGGSAQKKRAAASPGQSTQPFLIPQLVSACAAEKRNAYALTGPKETLSYGELEAESNALARYLLTLGVKPEVPVALFMERSAAFLIGSLGVMKAGAPYLPLDPSYPAERISLILNDARVSVVLTCSDVNATLPEGPWTVVNLSDPKSVLSPYSAASITFALQPSDLAYVIYTSGSTGRPKGVEITHANLLNLVRWHQNAFNVSSSDRATLLASPGFDAAVWEIWPNLAAGASLHIPADTTRVSPRSLRDWILNNRITISFVPTPLAQRMMFLDWPTRTSLRYLLTGGDVLQQYPPVDLPFALVNNYGPTECTVVAASGVVTANSAKSDLPPIGWAIANSCVYVLDENLQQVAAGAIGELHVGGANVGRGYIHDPELTAQKFIPDPFGTEPGARLYKTGDLARVLPDGRLEFLGRTDEQVKVRGFRIEPNEVSVALSKHAAIQSSIVVGRKDPSGEGLLAAYVVLKNGCEVCATELRKHLQSHVPDYMIPSAFVRLDALPLTPNGKVDRAALPEPGASNALRSDTAAQTRTPTEEKLMILLCDLLSIERVNPSDNFFLLGGHSLLGAQLLAQIQETFKIELPLRVLFDNPTVAGIAAEIDRRPNFASEANLSPEPAL